MGTYHQLTEYQRYQIYALKKVGHNLITFCFDPFQHALWPVLC